MVVLCWSRTERRGGKMPKVTMSLTDGDVRNTEKIRELLPNTRSNAHAVSIALSLTAYLADEMSRGDELLLRSPDGTLQRVVMPELQPVDRRRQTA